MFRSSNAAEELVKKATDEKLTTENWELIMNICDRVTNAEEASEHFKAINKRLMHRNANVLLYTMSLVEAMVKNCPKHANPEVASRAFTTTLTRVLNDKSTHREVKKRILGDIQQWAFDFRQDSNLSLMEETYLKLRNEGMKFPSPQKPEKIPKQSERDIQKEEDELQLALALSLSDYHTQQNKTSSHIRQEIQRQSQNTQSSSSASAKPPQPQRALKVKALYDFKASEPGELGFYKNDVITVLDQKFRDWWKGELRGSTGIFPANFVKSVDSNAPATSKAADFESQILSEAENIEVLLRKLSRIDPRRENLSENDEIQSLYTSTLALRPKIISLIEEYSRKKEKLEAINNKISLANQTYADLMNNAPRRQQAVNPVPYGSEQYIPQNYQQQPIQQQPPSQIYQQNSYPQQQPQVTQSYHSYSASPILNHQQQQQQPLQYTQAQSLQQAPIEHSSPYQAGPPPPSSQPQQQLQQNYPANNSNNIPSYQHPY